MDVKVSVFAASGMFMLAGVTLSQPSPPSSHPRAFTEPGVTVWRDMPITDLRKGVKLHEGSDDFSAINLGDFGNMSGNHGSYFGNLQTLPNHGFSAADKGSEVVHSPSVTLRTADAVPPGGGIVLDVADGYGELVLRLDAARPMRNVGQKGLKQ